MLTVALARALAPDPRLLLLDEPLAALDVTTRAEVRRDLKHHLTSFPGLRLVVTHDPRLVPFADRVIELDDGQLTSIASPARVLARAEVSDHTPPPAPFKKSPRLHLQMPKTAMY